MTRVGDRPGEVGVLGEEAVAGVDGIGTGLFDRVENGVGVDVGLCGGLATKRVGLVGEPDVQASRSSSLYTATEVMPSSRQARMTRTAISPRLAIRTLENTCY